jgi:putative transposase
VPDYRRYFVPGGTYFFTLVSYRRRPRFAHPTDLQRLRRSVAWVQQERPFRFLAAVVLPDHMHFLWTLPPADHDYSSRIGRIKVHFTRLCSHGTSAPIGLPESRRRHRESDVWQRRFWEHMIDEEGELEAFLDYIHYNPVKHGLVSCPHAWEASSFPRWVACGHYESSWGCCCQGEPHPPRDFAPIADLTGEP